MTAFAEDTGAMFRVFLANTVPRLGDLAFRLVLLVGFSVVAFMWLVFCYEKSRFCLNNVN